MFGQSFTKWISQAIFFTILIFLVFLGLKWFNIQAGTFTLWVSGVIAYWVLSGITILPWNVHFAADETLEEIRISKEKGLRVDEHREAYAQRVYKVSGRFAILIHLLVAAGFTLIAMFTEIGTIAYLAAGAALALTIVRPSIRACDHAVARLREIKNETKYPREDVLEMKERILRLEGYDKTAENLQKFFDEKCKQMEEANHTALDQIAQFTKQLGELKKYVDQRVSAISSATELVSAIETFEKRGIKSISFGNEKTESEK